MAGYGAETCVAGFPVSLRLGDAGFVEADEVPPHQHRFGKGFAPEQQDFALGGHLERELVATLTEVGEFIGRDAFSIDTCRTGQR